MIGVGEQHWDHGNLPGYKASPPSGRYQIIQLGDSNRPMNKLLRGVTGQCTAGGRTNNLFNRYSWRH